MPINGSENKNITTNTNSSTDNLGSISINNAPSTINNSVNTSNNAPLEEYDLSEPMLNEGVLDRNNLDFSRIATTAGNAKDGNFVNVKSPEYWGDNAPLTYKVRDDGTVAISEDGVVLGFTDLEGIRIKEADPSKEEQIVTEEKSEVSSEVETEIIQEGEETKEDEIIEEIEEVKEEPVEVKEEQTQEVVEEQIPVVPQEASPVLATNEAGKTVNVPGNVRQTGIIKNYTNYSYFYGKWDKGSQQERVAEMWNEAGRQQNNGIATLNGRYLVAVSPIFGTNGDIIDVVLDDGTVIPCIIGDAKGADATSQYGHMFGSSVDVIEWESYGSKEDIVIDQWADKNVVQIINKGSIFPN